MASHRSETIRMAAGIAVLIGAVLVAGTLTIRPTASADQTVAISGNHLANVSLSAELPATQMLTGEVVMALNNIDELKQFAEDLQNRDSPQYHKWLTPAEFAERFGPTPQQIQAVASWLTSRGLTVTRADAGERAVQFNGSYAEVKAALQVRIATDGQRYANLNDPQVPADLAPTILSIEGLIGNTAWAGGEGDSVLSTTLCPFCAGNPYFGPNDFYIFYDENTVLSSGNLGTTASENCPEASAQGPDCIAMIEDYSVNPAALASFVGQFATAMPSPAGTMPAISYTAAPTSVASPGLPPNGEPYLDLEWAHSVSPDTPLRIYYTNGPQGYVGAVQYAVNDNKCGAISSSTEDPKCLPTSTLKALDSYELQGTMYGQTIFKSSGDYGSNWFCGNPNMGAPTAVPSGFPSPSPNAQASCTAKPEQYADSNGNTWQPSIDEQASSENITVVGGTQFTPVYTPLPSPAVNQSVASPGVEVAWNKSATPAFTPGPGQQNCPVKDATGGGPSQIFGKPSWQANVTPNDGSRDVPDVAMGANDVAPGFFFAMQIQPAPTAGNPTPTPAPLTFDLAWGTSIATPMWAGVSRLLARAQGVCRLGNVNQRLYEMGTLELASPSPGQTPSPSNSSLGLVDTVSGDNSNDGVPGYSATPGYDLVTGWGSPDIAKFIAAFPGAETSTTPVNTTVKRGAVAAAGTFTVQNTTAAALVLDQVTIQISKPNIFSKLTLTVTVGSGNPQAARAMSAHSTVFKFSPAITIPSLASATLVLTANTGGSSAAGMIDPGSSDRTDRGGYLVLAIGILSLLAWMWLTPSRRRTAYALTVMLMISGLAVVASDCGGGSSSSSTTATGTSTQTIPRGGADLGDGQGGVVKPSGLPSSLGTVTVQ